MAVGTSVQLFTVHSFEDAVIRAARVATPVVPGPGTRAPWPSVCWVVERGLLAAAFALRPPRVRWSRPWVVSLVVAPGPRGRSRVHRQPSPRAAVTVDAPALAGHLAPRSPCSRRRPQTGRAGDYPDASGGPRCDSGALATSFNCMRPDCARAAPTSAAIRHLCSPALATDGLPRAGGRRHHGRAREVDGGVRRHPRLHPGRVHPPRASSPDSTPCSVEDSWLPSSWTPRLTCQIPRLQGASSSVSATTNDSVPCGPTQARRLAVLSTGSLLKTVRGATSAAGSARTHGTVIRRHHRRRTTPPRRVHGCCSRALCNAATPAVEGHTKTTHDRGLTTPRRRRTHAD